MKKIKVLHAPTAVGGNPPALSKALRKQGIDSECCIISQNYLAYEVDRVLVPAGARFLQCELKRFKFILECLFKYDIIHYNAGTTIATANIIEWPGKKNSVSSLKRFVYSAYLRGLQYFEVSLFRLFRKKLFLTYQGDDARQGQYCLDHYSVSIATQVDDSYYSAKTDAFKQKNIAYLSRRCQQVYALNPDLLNVLPAATKFIPYSHVFFDEWPASFEKILEKRPLRIVHAPTNRRVKGTDLIIEALNSLSEEGLEFELVLVEGLSQAEARKCYEQADVLIDQIFAGWYGGLAVELMALGKPVLVYLRDEDLHFIPDAMREELPFIRVTPASLKEVLREVILTPREELLERAKNSRAFVEKWHDPERIARLISQDYADSFNGR
ncbi:glycosyltransferase family 1 protein [Pseudomonas sp. zfem004]|uniref:glycosyltransferase family 1 protein n=1 Tax=unclassified Pseudomonas TaxID=196821 RepID=UPI00129ABA80|nr:MULTISPECIES: glycosyltransferase family 1 protein [unclassified Pseudomonas]MDU9404607.1 glycosyltransferase family 1 protein [Pseudomonas sp. zfem004]